MIELPRKCCPIYSHWKQKNYLMENGYNMPFLNILKRLTIKNFFIQNIGHPLWLLEM